MYRLQPKSNVAISNLFYFSLQRAAKINMSNSLASKNFLSNIANIKKRENKENIFANFDIFLFYRDENNQNIFHILNVSIKYSDFPSLTEKIAREKRKIIFPIAKKGLQKN